MNGMKKYSTLLALVFAMTHLNCGKQSLIPEPASQAAQLPAKDAAGFQTIGACSSLSHKTCTEYAVIGATDANAGPAVMDTIKRSCEHEAEHRYVQTCPTLGVLGGCRKIRARDKTRISILFYPSQGHISVEHVRQTCDRLGNEFFIL